MLVAGAACTRKANTLRTYRMGYGHDEPLHYKDPDGKPEGLAIDVLEAAAKRRGISLEWMESRYGIEGIRDGNFDFWVLLTITPERRKQVHFTEPYLVTETAFLVRQNSVYRTVQDLANSRIAFNDIPIQRISLSHVLPRSRYVPLASTELALAALQDGSADAAYVDQYAGIVGLVGGAARNPLRIISSGEPVRELAIASSFATADIADELREEIAAMSENHEIAQVLGQWSMFPFLTADSMNDLNSERRKVKVLAVGATALAVLLLAVILLLWRLRQKTQFLRESEARNRSLNEAAFEGVMIHDGTHILDANPQFAKLFGYDQAAELLGAGAPQLLDDASEAVATSPMRFGSGLRSTELTGIRKDGTSFPVESQGCDSWYQGKPVRVVAMRDITERKRSEEERVQAQKLESIGRLAGGVAHDFNNLLTVINGYSHLIVDDPGLSAKAKARASHVLGAGQRAADLTRQLLAFSRKQVIKPRPTNLNAVVLEARGMLSRVMPENISIVCHLAENPGAILADIGQMNQVVMNLALNARDAMPQGGVLRMDTLNLSRDPLFPSRSDAVEGPCVLLSVRDNGIGMEHATAGKIFEPFFTTKPLGAGTGLGLATVYGIVRQNGGCIRVESEPNKGSAFLVYLPLLAEFPREEPPEIAQPARSTAGTILVVEDQAELRSLVIEILEEQQYRVLSAPNGEAALAVASNLKEWIELLITDVIMPGISGKELADRMQVQRGDLKVLFVSGYTADVVMSGGIVPPLIAFLAKPLTPDSLLAKVSEILG